MTTKTLKIKPLFIPLTDETPARVEIRRAVEAIVWQGERPRIVDCPDIVLTTVKQGYAVTELNGFNPPV